MKYRKLTSGGDYTFGGNANDFYSDVYAVAQAIKTAFGLLLGEWWEDTSQGFPLFDNVLGMPGTPDHIRAVDMLIQETIMGVQGVNEVSSFASTYENRIYQFTCTINTQYGQLVLKDVTFKDSGSNPAFTWNQIQAYTWDQISSG